MDGISKKISLNNEPCCVCSSGSSRLMFETTYPEHRYPGEFCLRRCDGCGLMFNSPRLDDAGLARLYGENYYFFRRGDPREFQRIVGMYRRTVGMLPETPTRKRVLDVGTGRGYFPAVLQRLGWEVAGVEISPSASDYAREHFKLDVFRGTIEQYATSAIKETFPLVTAIDLIEHVPHPAAFVAALAQVVEPGGRLIIDTPSAGSKNIDIEGIWWKGFNPFHIYLFRIDNLTKLLEQHGFTVEQSFSYGNTASDESPKPMAQRLSASARKALHRMGVLGPVARGYLSVKGSRTRDTDPAPHADKAAAEIKNLPTYAGSVDAKARLGAEKRGDNLVVIARKN